MAVPSGIRFDMRFAGRVVQVATRHSSRARRLGINIKKDQLEIVLPRVMEMTQGQAEELIRKHAKALRVALDRLSLPKEEPPELRTVAVGARSIAYSVRRSERARQVLLKVKNGAVELVVPPGTHVREAEEFLRSKADWVLERVDSQRAAAASAQDAVAAWRNTVLFRGERLPARAVFGTANRVRLRDGALEVTVNRKSPTEPSRVLDRWLKDQALEAIRPVLTARSKEMGVTPNKVFLRDNRTTWGTCSRMGNIGLSWRLVMAPPEVLDAIVVHELAHMTELNHSKAFHAVVREHCPGCAEADAWLKKNGWALLAPIEIEPPLP